jgi:signal transduction histidine kinase/CheY-like chemotaxis protein
MAEASNGVSSRNPLADASEPVVILEPHRPYVWVNKAFFLLGGWDPVSTSLERVILPHEQERLRSIAGLGAGRQRPGQVCVPYLKANGSQQLMYLNYRPLIPTTTWLSDPGDGSCSDSTTVICTCAWVPSMDYRDLLYRFTSGRRVNGYDVHLDAGDASYWFYNADTAGFFNYSDQYASLDKTLGKQLGLEQGELDWWLDVVRRMKDDGTRVSEVKRALYFREKRMVIRSRLHYLGDHWSLPPRPRVVQVTEDITDLELLSQELSSERLKSVSNARRLELLDMAFEEAPVITAVVELDCFDTERREFKDFLHLLSNRSTRQHRRGSEILPTREDLSLWMHHFQQAEQLRAPVQFEWCDRGAPGSGNVDRWYSVFIRCQSATRFSYLMSDISSQKSAAVDLQHTVRERTRDLSVAVAAKSRLLANISHEIRTPLMGIFGYLSLLRSSSLSRAQEAELFRTVSWTGDHLLWLLEDQLRIADGAPTQLPAAAQLSEFSPAECLEEALETASFLLSADQKQELDLLNDVQPAALPELVRADATALRRVVLELLRNAIRFTPRGQVSIAARFDGPTQELLVDISDTGPGIPSNIRDILFSPLVQAAHTSSGIGLGLNACKRSVEAMHGTVTCRSTAGSGSVFSVRVPVVVCQAAPAISLAFPAAEVRRAIALILVSPWARRMERQIGDVGLNLRSYRAPQEYQSGCDAMVIAGGISVMDRLPPLLPIILIDYEYPLCRLPENVRFLRKPYRPAALIALLAECVSKPPSPTRPQPSVAARLEQSPTLVRHGSAVHSERILIADDNVLNQKILKKMLESLGWSNVYVVDDGYKAVEAVRDHDAAAEPISLVVMDIMMPVVDGVEATRRICALPLTRRPRVLAFTADATEARRRECTDAGADGFLTKPIRLQQLNAALGRLLSVGT